MTNDVICIWRPLLSMPRQFSISEKFGGWQPCYQVSCNVRVPTNERWRCVDTPSPPSLPNTVNLPPGGQRWCWHVALLNVKTSTGVLSYLIENRSLYQRVFGGQKRDKMKTKGAVTSWCGHSFNSLVRVEQIASTGWSAQLSRVILNTPSRILSYLRIPCPFALTKGNSKYFYGGNLKTIKSKLERLELSWRLLYRRNAYA